ncbi:ABC transporter permease [Paenibacillus sp. 22594]|uniref:ABC transporter permease n=1 Tax=Paenibacillus sp. 22594 TaxID=3453947 RepID=UPI003F841F77
MKNNKYIAIMRSSIQDSIAYRTAFFSNLLFSVVKMVCLFYIWKAIFASNEVVNGFGWENLKQYLLISYICNNLLSLKTDYEISKKIMVGSVVMDLLRPINFQKANFAQTLGASIFEGTFSTVFVGTLLKFAFDIPLPNHPQTWIMTAISILCSLWVRYTLIFLFSLLCFWTTSINGIVAFRTALINLFSGALIPLNFFPEWFKTVALFSPFQSLLHTPASIFLQKVDIHTAISLIGVQILWFGVMWFLGSLFWRKAIKKLTVYGG